MRGPAAMLRGAALTIVSVAGAASLTVTARAEGTFHPPGDTLLVANGFPTYAPDPEAVRGEDALLAWAERTGRLAAAQVDPALRGALLAAAAEVHLWRPAYALHGHALLMQAVSALPAHDPDGALVRLQLMTLGTHATVPDGWLGEARRAWDYALSPPVEDGSPAVRARDALARREIRRRFPPLALRLAERLGDVENALGWATWVATLQPHDTRVPLALRRERVALLHARRGDVARARSWGEDASSVADDPETQARLAFWRLHLEHGLLDAEGRLAPTRHPPGPDFVRDVEAVLRGLAGNPEASGYLLSSASSAFQARAWEQALALYRIAMDDRALLEKAWRDPALYGGLLPAVVAARAAGRFDEAEALLASIEQIAGERIALSDELRAAIKLDRERAARGLPPVEPPPPPPEPAAPPPREAGRLELPEAPARPPPRGALPLTAPDAADGAGAPAWPWAAAALAALVALLLVRFVRRT